MLRACPRDRHQEPGTREPQAKKESCDDDDQVRRQAHPLPAHQPGHRRLWHRRELVAPTTERIPPMTTMKLTGRYARYLLTNLATVAFGIMVN
jgi:hypothetical protein